MRTVMHGNIRIRPRRRYPRHPIWAILRADGRSQAWLARVTGYSVSHVHNVSAGNNPAAPAFRARCAAALKLDEATLFHPAEPSIASPPSEDGAVNRDGTAAGAVYAAPEMPSRRSA